MASRKRCLHFTPPYSASWGHNGYSKSSEVTNFYQRRKQAIALLQTIGMSVCPSVRLSNSGTVWKRTWFLPCDAMRCTVSVIVILSVCPSVRPSITLVDCVHMVRPTIMISSPYGSPIILVSGDITFIPKFEGGRSPRARALNEGRVGTNWRFSTNKSPYLRYGARYDKDYC